MKTPLFAFLPLLPAYLLISAFPITPVHGNELEALKHELQTLELQEKEIKQRKDEISKRMDALSPKLKGKPARNIVKKVPLKRHPRACPITGTIATLPP